VRSFRNDWLCINHLGIQSSTLLTVLAQTVPNEGPSHLTGFDIYRSWRNIINVRLHTNMLPTTDGRAISDELRQAVSEALGV
jgi:hypothetical protein